jgi:uncharacterized membrane protein
LKISWTSILIGVGVGILLLILIIAAGTFLNLPSVDQIGSLTFLLGSVVLVCGYYHLVYVLPRMAKDMETRVSMEALKVSFWLVIFGLIIIVLGVLYLMGILPPLTWRT